MLHKWVWKVVVALLFSAVAGCWAQTQFNGIEYVGRWTGQDGARVASYGGSAVQFKFRDSTSLSVDLTALEAIKDVDLNSSLYIRVIVDGGAPERIGLVRGVHPGYLLAQGLSKGAHTVELRYDQEPLFGALQVGHISLDPGGTWETFSDPRPIIEIIDDSDATGIGVLGPTNPGKHVNLATSAWSSQLLSWPALLESGLSAFGHPAVVVDLALSGSTAATEADTYDQSAPILGTSKFTAYSSGRKASLVLFWGGSNDKNTGGELASGSPVTYANLSPFQRGIYDQIMKVTALHPDAQLGFLEYSDPNLPHWTPAYMQLKALLPPDIQQKMHFLVVKDDPANFNACDVAPNGHPNRTTHQFWTAQILQWILAEKLLPAE
ncbi:MAG: hypothetical protein P4L40_18915 [Terracidiphilus sp.]|nr:hypothetical protein [Terracidiphilus sp.]